MHDFFIERKQVSLLDEWKIDKIYSTRAEKNAESDPELTKSKYCLDAIAFGLSSFRSKQTSKVEALLRKGVNIRIITMNPNSQFALIRDKEENKNDLKLFYNAFLVGGLSHVLEQWTKNNFEIDIKYLVKAMCTLTPQH